MKTVRNFIRKEPVFVISFLCALISAAFYPPCREYTGYIDWKVLGTLFSLMGIVAGLQACGIFEKLAHWLLAKCSSLLALRLCLVMLTFFTSMFITNDVSLITFVPFGIAVLISCGCREYIISTVVLQTIAANLGSMVTPVGNPQSLYLYTEYSIPVGRYFALMLPLTAVSFLGLIIASSCCRREMLTADVESGAELRTPGKAALYGILFLIALLSVVRLISWVIPAVAVALFLLIFDRNILKKVDWMLLATFVCFFIFSGNLGNIPTIRVLLEKVMERSTLLASLIASQIISNVPAAVLLSSFTADGEGLLLGTNIGGLGTIIASLASLISFKAYLQLPGARAGKYLLTFTLYNIVALVILLGIAFLIT